MPNNYVIEKATLIDSPPLLSLLNTCTQAMHQQGMSHWLNVYDVDSVNANLQQKKVFKLIKEDMLIGCVALATQPADYYAACWPDAPPADWYLTQLAVLPAFQGEGWGQCLVQYCIEQVHPQKLQLDAVAHYPALLAFYKKLGFRQVAEGIGLGDRRFLFELSARHR